MTRADPPSRHRRALSEDERALWETIVKSAKPLKKAAPKNCAKNSAKKKPVPDAAATRVSARAGPARPAAPPLAKAKPPAPPPLSSLTRRERGRIARGRKEIDARIDLHGKTLIQAHGILKRFLTRAQADGATLVLVITGKGRTTSEGREGGALRREVPEWLGLPEFRGLVTGFEEAHVGHGGEGALYVRVRRAR